MLLPALFSCKGGRTTTSSIDWQPGEQFAVAFLGYYDSFGTFQTAPSYVGLTRTFPQLANAVQVEAGVGREMYLVLPRNPETTVSVVENGPFDPDGQARSFYSDRTGAPILLHTNFYGTDSRIVCKDASGATVSFVPQVDEMTGALLLPPDGGVHDISLPIPEPMEGYLAFDYGKDFDGRDLGVKIRLQAGKPVLTLYSAPLAVLGYDPEAFVLNEGENQFSGINGLCKGVFLGTIGQDYNPVACVVMENGDVKKCSIFYAMQHGEPELSSALPGFKDVTGFEEDGGGAYELEDGQTAFEYRTIYALDARGGRNEIPQFNDYGVFLARDGAASIDVTLTPDWRFYLNRFTEDGSSNEVYIGSFAVMDRGVEEDKFSYRIERYAYQAGDEFQFEEKVSNGRFTAREKGLSYEVSVSGADIFKAGTEFRDAELVGIDEGIEYD